MDIVETIVSSVVARRAMLVEQFLMEHKECWPLPAVAYAKDHNLADAKCSCGAQLEVVILTKLVVNSYQPK